MIAINEDLPDEYKLDNVYSLRSKIENRDESHRLAQPKAAYEFLSEVKSIAEEALGEGDYQLPGLVQVFEVISAKGEFFPRGHFKQVIARVLFEDGITRTLNGYEYFDIGDAQTPPGGEAGFNIIPDDDASQQSA